MIRIASVGAGYFARFQIAAWARMAGADLVAIAEPDARRRADAGNLAPSATLVEALPQLWAHTADLVDIATPPNTHAELVQSCLGRVRAVICQKPFCTSLSEARGVVAAARDSGTDLIVHENFRFQPWYRKIAEILQTGHFGQVRQARFSLRTGDGRGPDAYRSRQPYFQQMPRFLIRETGIHYVDTFRYLFGEPQAVYADLRRENPAIAGEDAGLVVFETATGARIVFDGNRTLDHGASNHRLTLGEFGVECTGGELRLNGDGEIFLRPRGHVGWGAVPFAFDDRDFGGNCVEAFQTHVLAGLTDGNEIETRAEAYLRNLELEALIYESAETGRRLAVQP